MVDAPCSRVGHIFRNYAPFPNPGIGDFVHKVSTQGQYTGLFEIICLS